MANLTQIERIERAQEAARLLEHPLIVEAFKGVRDGIIAQWESSDSSVSREALWAGLHGAKRLEVWLEALKSDGAMAAHEAAQAERDKQ